MHPVGRQYAKGIAPYGLPRRDALLDACHKRARPIVMTTIALTAGMLPIALGIGADPSFRQPMAIVAIGGAIAFHGAESSLARVSI